MVIINRQWKPKESRESIMDESLGTAAEMSKSVIKDGYELTIYARRCEEGEWQLSVENEHGISANWLEFFPTARRAIGAAVEAIEKEGVEPFAGTEGHEYNEQG